MNPDVTVEEINTQLAVYTDERRLVMYRSAEERLLALGQENWNGDKKHFEGRVDYLQNAINDLESKIRKKKRKSKCGISGCSIAFI